MESSIKDPRDKYILFYFIAFFGVIIAVNGIFIYFALSSFTGLVTDNAYERGLDYNQTIAKAKSQPKLNQTAIYDGKFLRWNLANENNIPIENATVIAKIMRPVHDGYDFDVILEHKGGGIYEANLELPMKGAWLAKLSSKWNDKQYQTTYEFIAK